VLSIITVVACGSVFECNKRARRFARLDSIRVRRFSGDTFPVFKFVQTKRCNTRIEEYVFSVAKFVPKIIIAQFCYPNLPHAVIVIRFVV